MKHIIIGTGPAGVIAAETLRGADAEAEIILIGDEPEAPYSRMALPYLLAENIDESGTHLRHGKGHYAKLNINLIQDRVSGVSPADKTIKLESGASHGFDRLLIATGSHTTKPPIAGMDLPGIENCWTLADARRIETLAKPGSNVVLMGAGFIGCIVLEALAARDVKLTVVEMEDRMVPRMMDNTGGDMIKRWCEKQGVRVLTATRVEGITKSGSGLDLSLAGGETLSADLVVCATGVRANIAFLDGSGIATDQGILVNHQLETNQPGIYAAGDVAQGPDFSTGNNEIHAIQPTASEHGKVAALNMAGKTTDYRGSLSMNVLNTLGLVSSSYGLWQGVEGGDRSEAVDNEEFRYLRLEFDGDKLVGSLSLGLTQHVGVLRGLIQTGVSLGRWKEELMRDPHRIMDAYVECAKVG